MNKKLVNNKRKYFKKINSYLYRTNNCKNKNKKLKK